MVENTVTDQMERYWLYLTQQVEGKAAPELAEMQSALIEALDSMSTKFSGENGRYLAAIKLMKQVWQHLDRSREEGTDVGTVEETPLNRVVSEIEDPVLRRAVESSGKFILKVERETNMPPLLASGHYIVIRTLNADIVDNEQKTRS